MRTRARRDTCAAINRLSDRGIEVVRQPEETGVTRQPKEVERTHMKHYIVASLMILGSLATLPQIPVQDPADTQIEVSDFCVWSTTCEEWWLAN